MWRGHGMKVLHLTTGSLMYVVILLTYALLLLPDICLIQELLLHLLASFARFNHRKYK